MLPNDRQALIELALAQLRKEGDDFSLDATLRGWESAYIEAAQRLTQGNVSQAAKLLGINRTTLYNRMETLARDRDRI
jgi:two-component system nitrogen regulation response regulator GlnG